MTTPLTLEALTARAREDGWVVAVTTNVHLDRPDWPAGTGAVLVEAFDEDGLPAHYARGTDKEGLVVVAGDKLNARPEADTVEAVLEWARYTWDSPDDPLPGGAALEAALAGLAEPSEEPGPVYVNEGWWSPSVKDGRVHLHPDTPNRAWPAAMHRECEPVYTRRTRD